MIVRLADLDMLATSTDCFVDRFFPSLSISEIFTYTTSSWIRLTTRGTCITGVDLPPLGMAKQRQASYNALGQS